MTDSHKKTPREGEACRLLSEGSSDEIGNLPSRLDRYSSARHRAKTMIAHLKTAGDFKGEIKALSECSNYLLFHHYYTVGTVRLVRSHSCKKHLLCPLCAVRRGAKYLREYLARLAQVTADRPTLRPYMVTLTVKNGPDLAERFRHLVSSVNRYHRTRRNWLGRANAPYTEVCKAEGAVWSYEVTNTGKGWHPHVHAVWLCETPPDHYQLSREWEAITGDSMIVSVDHYDDQPTEKMFSEVFKYAMKFSGLGLDDNVEAYIRLRGKRLIGAFGALYGVKVSANLDEDVLADLPYIELFYTFRDGAGYDLRSTDSVNPGRVA